MIAIATQIYNDFNIEQLGYDFMGYFFEKKNELSFHHIKPLNQGGLTEYSNGSLLVRNTSHNYIHTIEFYDFNLFLEITEELKKENKNGITKEHLIAIRQMLEYFESKFEYEKTKKGLPIIKEEYVRRRIEL